MAGGSHRCRSRDKVGQNLFFPRRVHFESSLLFRFVWHQKLLGKSEADIVWHVPNTQKSGRYRIRHWGFAKPLGAKRPSPFVGKTRTFRVNNTSEENMNEKYLTLIFSDSPQIFSCPRPNAFPRHLPERLSRGASLFRVPISQPPITSRTF